jgi:two-component sensor histidine kinase
MEARVNTGLPSDAAPHEHGFVAVVQWLRPARRLPVWAQYAATILLVLAALALRFALEDVYRYPLLTFFPTILVAALLFGWGAGILAALLGGCLAFWFFVEPRGGGAFLLPDGLVALAAFIAVGIFAAFTVDTARATVDDLAEANRRLRAADAQKTVLLADINHRLKNSLHAVAGILSAEGRRMADTAGRMVLEDAAGRLRVLARVHERLHLGPSAKEATSVDMRGFLDALCADLRPTLVDLRPVALRLNVEDITLGVAQAIAVGLIVNELVTNALRHAFPDDRAGTVSVRLSSSSDGWLSLQVVDDGVGTKTDGSGTGTRLIRALAQQLGGTVEQPEQPRGIDVRVRFPVAEIT